MIDTTETNRPPSQIPSGTSKRQKPPQLFVDLELNGSRIASFEASSSLTVARAKVGEQRPLLVGTTLRLPSRFVSRSRHCTIEPVEDGKILVRDYASTNGTAVNERPVDRELTISTPCTVSVAPFDLIVSRVRESYETARLRDRPLTGDADLRLDTQSGLIRLRDGTAVGDLSPLQHAIVVALIESYPRPMMSAQLLETVNPSGSLQGLYTQINELRDRLEASAPGGRELIQSRRNFGYSITPLPEA